mmetsp:Transcript_46472/g.100164  ORF Transcript_46472/g.100164 Transcript_46472/m.100164 type:complete len:149 (-) Transcript_46472:41-487(-)
MSSQSATTRRVSFGVDDKVIVAIYMAAVMSCRFILNQACTAELHWLVIMALEDGMSLLSFFMGLWYFRRCDGRPLSLLAKRMGSRQETSAAPASDSESEAESELESDSENLENFSNFSNSPSGLSGGSSSSATATLVQRPLRLVGLAL